MQAVEPGRRTVDRLQKAMLLHLVEGGGSTKWGAIYSKFSEHGIGEIGDVLGRLAQLNHVMVDSDGSLKITASGWEQLKSEESYDSM